MATMHEGIPQRISMGMNLTGRVEKHGDSYVSFCNELPLVGIGITSEDAMNSFLECFKEYIRLSIEWGVIDKVAADYGFTINQSVNITSGNFTMSLPGVIDTSVMASQEAAALA